MTHVDRGESKKTILHLPPGEAQDWCARVSDKMLFLWVRETLFRDSANKYAALSVQTMMRDGRKTAHPHLKRAQELRDGDCNLTGDVMWFVANMAKMFKGERQTPFEDEAMTQDDARSWLAEKRTRMLRKIKREQNYRAAVPYPDKNAATEEETALQEEVVLLLNELLKTYPPKRLPRPKKEHEQND